MYKNGGNMKRLLSFLLAASLLFAPNAFAIDEWLKGQPAGSASPSDIDTLVQVSNEALDRLMSYGRFGCKLAYDTVAQITVGAGSIVCSNSAGTVRRTRTNPSATTVTWANIDTGSEAVSTTYYVYAVADTDVVTFTIKISTNSSAPSGITYYHKLGSFYNNSDGNITLVLNNDYAVYDHTHDGTDSSVLGASAISAVLGAWASKNKDTSYEAATDGLVLAFGACEPTEWITIKTDAANPPTTVRAQAGSWGFDVRDGAMCPVKKGDYYKVEDEGGTISDLTIYWIPIGS